MPKVHIKVVGSLADGVKTNLQSKPTLDLQITPISSQTDAFELRSIALRALNLTIS